MTVRVQEGDFEVGAELDGLTRGNRRIGADLESAFLDAHGHDVVPFSRR